MKDVKSKSYTLYDDNKNWLGQIVLTSDGMFASVTDWGNLSYAWRSYGQSEGKDFRKFICEINVDYFAGKMYLGNSYILHTRKCRKDCERFAEKILPPLQKVLKKEIEEGIEL